MWSVNQVVVGTVRFVRDEFLGAITQPYIERLIVDSVFDGDLKVTDGSNFILGRAIERGTLPLNIRGGHVPDEAEFVVLEPTTRPRQVRYVIQEHNATGWTREDGTRVGGAGRHYDLRIEYDSRAVSWAIPMKGKRDGVHSLPSPGERGWAALRQPDHVLKYMGFEGEITNGKGSGTVKIVAEGIADLHKIGTDGTVHLRLLSGMGTLPGTRDLVFVPTDGDVGSSSGLLVGKDPGEGEHWQRPSYTRKELEDAQARAQHRQSVAESKVDGSSVELQFGKAGPRIFSHRVSRRTGRLIEHTDRLPHVQSKESHPELRGTRLRGEAWHRRGVNFSSGLLNSHVDRARNIQRSAGPVKIDIFDITHYKGEDIRTLPYSERRALYEQVCRDLDSPYVRPVRQVSFPTEEFYWQQVNLKSKPTDGIVVKSMEAGYGEQPIIKVKPSDLADCKVVGVTEGRGKHRGRLGAFTVESPSGDLVQVGTGFTDSERSWIWNHRGDIQGEVARVEFHVRSGQRTDTGPRFDSWHPDKSEAALAMYAEAMGVNKYQLKNAAGWRRAS